MINYRSVAENRPKRNARSKGKQQNGKQSSVNTLYLDQLAYDLADEWNFGGNGVYPYSYVE
jgi:hypothetical protein